MYLCTEFVFRVYADGRRERKARVIARDKDGKEFIWNGRLAGAVRSEVSRSLAVAAQELSPPRSGRRRAG